MKESTFKKYCLVIDEWFVNGRNGTQAYLSIYPGSSYDSADVSFREILEIPRIKEYITSKEETISEQHNITLEGQIKALQDIINSKDCSNRDKISALQEQNKLVALYEKHNEQKKPIIRPSKIRFIKPSDG